MTDIVDLEKARLETKVKRGFRNWRSQFKETFVSETHFSDISLKTLTFLARGREDAAFYFFDLIMGLMGLGSGFEFNELNAKDKMAVMDRYLFLLDRARFEYMKRLGWLEGFSGEIFPLVDLIRRYEKLSSGLQATPPALSREHPAFQIYCKMNTFEKEEFVRKLIPKALKAMEDQPTTL